MKLFQSILLIAAITVLSSACVSRTTTSTKSFGDDANDTKLVWIWQDEFSNSK